MPFRTGLDFAMPASLRRSRHGDNETSQVPGPPSPHLPCSPTPSGPPCQAVSARRCCPRCLHDEGPSDHILSRLNHTASAVAVYASSPGSPPANARLASGCRLRSAEWDWLPTEWLRKVSNAYFTLSPFPRLDLARIDRMFTCAPCARAAPPTCWCQATAWAATTWPPVRSESWAPAPRPASRPAWRPRWRRRRARWMRWTCRHCKHACEEPACGSIWPPTTATCVAAAVTTSTQRR